MKKLRKRDLRILISLFIAIITAAGVFATPASEHIAQFAQQQNPGLYEVASVADGDTLSVVVDGKKERVRLIGVDTPEKNDPRKPVQCFAEAASNFAKSKVPSHVRLEADPEGDNRDRYNRMLRHVYLPDGTLLNKHIIEEGYGFAVTGFPHSKMDEFVAAERTARNENRGLWGSCQIDTSGNYLQTKPE